MILSGWGVLLVGVVVLLLLRKDGLKLSHAVACGLFGFYLAGSTVAPGIEAGGKGLADLLGALAS